MALRFLIPDHGAATTVPEEEKEIHAWLQEREIRPEDLAVVGAPYGGPQIVEN